MRRRGFTMIEMLWVLVLLVMVAAIADQIFYQSMRVMRDQRVRQWNDAAAQSLSDHLRADVWASSSAQTRDGALHLQVASGEITYRIEEQHVRRVHPGELDMRWERHGESEFAVAGELIMLKSSGQPDEARMFVAPVIGQGGGR